MELLNCLHIHLEMLYCLFFTLLSPSITSSPLTSCNKIFLFLCSLRSRAAPCSPHPHRSTCRGWRVWWRPCRHQQRPAAPVQRTFCILHSLVHTNTHTELQRTHTGLHTYILPSSLHCSYSAHQNKHLCLVLLCLMLWKQHTQRFNTASALTSGYFFGISVGIFNLCESMFNNVRITSVHPSGWLNLLHACKHSLFVSNTHS